MADCCLCGPDWMTDGEGGIEVAQVGDAVGGDGHIGTRLKKAVILRGAQDLIALELVVQS